MAWRNAGVECAEALGLPPDAFSVAGGRSAKAERLLELCTEITAAGEQVSVSLASCSACLGTPLRGLTLFICGHGCVLDLCCIVGVRRPSLFAETQACAHKTGLGEQAIIFCQYVGTIELLRALASAHVSQPPLEIFPLRVWVGFQ